MMRQNVALKMQNHTAEAAGISPKASTLKHNSAPQGMASTADSTALLVILGLVTHPPAERETVLRAPAF